MVSGTFPKFHRSAQISARFLYDPQRETAAENYPSTIYPAEKDLAPKNLRVERDFIVLPKDRSPVIYRLQREREAANKPSTRFPMCGRLRTGK